MSTTKSAGKRAEELRAEIAEHDHRYYVLDDPVVGDDVYDALMAELRALEEEHAELVTPNLRTIRAIPLTIPDAPARVEVRGEIYFPRAAFAEFNEQRASEGLSTF